MLKTLKSIKYPLLAAAIATGLVAAVPTLTFANGLPGLTIFGGPGRENTLPFRLDYDGIANQWDRYRLRVPQKKLTEAVQQFTISYAESPANFTGIIDPDKVEVRIKGKAQPLAEVIWDQENKLVEIYPEDPIPAATGNLELVFSNVKNPGFGIYRFKCLIFTPGEVPLPRYIGTWEVSISP
ncbi:MAG: DUF2808 domain-containing protein [Roseofilum sp. SBFL]|uniref:DUF2808 domain-containing protein n=1 Tax=unclassified Roseofilum TaxID=2620099 RepID=UPI001B137CBE|nr:MULTISPECIES: DUF2808 domain-containing protein [unclassified Roseofilum]MBP0015762.1 DUF2808 domain-containing protein [Roseofilum sp. SID3]MBP0025589.1 DUF2808 domain-containing protein [Roseofilum sp. SID2]MBP0037688.1 DUF2808 domain-containing protein [Roseofilum sp. SID1]MBP0040996.1 DUF2808 domain-containing protein [Roseofilum sp. SBFL]